MVTASHRSAIALRKATEFVPGRPWVCGLVPAPGATGRAAVGEACRVALRVGVVALPAGAAVPADVAAADGDPVPDTPAVAAGGDDADDALPHPASTAPVRSMPSGLCHDSLMPPPRRLHLGISRCSREYCTVDSKCGGT